MRTHCQFTVKRPEKRVDLTVAPNNNPAAFKWWSGLSIQPKLAAPEADVPPFSVSIDKQGIRLHSLKGFQDSH